MKVTMVVSYFDEQYGGHEFYLCRELVRFGHDVKILTSDRDRPGYGELKTKENEYTVDGIRVKRLHTFAEISEIPLMLGLKKALIKDDIEIIHTHEFFQYGSYYSMKVAKQLKLPFILTQHGYKKPVNKFIRIPYWVNERTIGKYVMKRADKIITLTPFVRDHLINLGIPKTNILVISTGVPTEMYTPDIESSLIKYVQNEEKTILFVGRLTENKGVISLLKAFKNVRKHMDNVKLIILGKGKMEFEIKKIAKQLEIEKDTIFIGYVSQKDMPAIYAGADVFVLPTLYKEPFGIAAVEAISSGVPVVASNVGGLSSIVKHGKVGYLTNPGDVKELSLRIIQILENEELRINLSNQAREWAIKEFSWKNKAMAVIRTYKEALSEYL